MDNDFLFCIWEEETHILSELTTQKAEIEKRNNY